MKKPIPRSNSPPPALDLDDAPESAPLSSEREVLPRESEMPRALVGWPEGSVYVPREPAYFADFFPPEAPSPVRRGRRGRYDRKKSAPSPDIVAGIKRSLGDWLP